MGTHAPRSGGRGISRRAAPALRRCRSGHQAETVVHGGDHAPALHGVPPAHHQARGTAAIEVEGVSQARRAQNPGRLQQRWPRVVDALKGDEPKLAAIAADDRSRCPLAKKGGGETLGPAIQDDLPIQQQQRPPAHHVGRLPQVAAALAGELQSRSRTPGQGSPSAGHQEILPGPQGHTRRQRRAVEAALHDAIPQHHASLRAAQGAVEGAPIHRVAGQPGAHVTAVHEQDRQWPTAAIAHPLPKFQTAEAGQGGGLPGHNPPIQDGPGQPAPPLPQGSEGQAAHPVEVAAIDGHQGVVAPSQQGKGGQAFHPGAAAEGAQLEGAVERIDAHAVASQPSPVGHHGVLAPLDL
ncbi:MAG: hypothetical protein RLZZ117_1218 [Cyanobacteriota bacterium]